MSKVPLGSSEAPYTYQRGAYVVGVIASPSCIGIGLMYLPKHSRDESPSPFTSRHARPNMKNQQELIKNKSPFDLPISRVNSFPW